MSLPTQTKTKNQQGVEPSPSPITLVGIVRSSKHTIEEDHGPMSANLRKVHCWLHYFVTWVLTFCVLHVIGLNFLTVDTSNLPTIEKSSDRSGVESTYAMPSSTWSCTGSLGIECNLSENFDEIHLRGGLVFKMRLDEFVNSYFPQMETHWK